METTVKIPVARTRGADSRLVRATDATKSEGPFFCIDHDDEELVLHIGTKILKSGKPMHSHFARKPGGVIRGGGLSCNTSPESCEHAEAKVIIAKNLSSLSLYPECNLCQRPCIHLPIKFIDPPRYAATEVSVNNGKYRLDVGIFSEQSKSLVGAIEVFKTHAVSAVKFADLHQLFSGCVYEIAAKDVLEGWEKFTHEKNSDSKHDINDDDDDDGPVTCALTCKLAPGYQPRCEPCRIKRLRPCAGCGLSFDVDEVVVLSQDEKKFACKPCITNCPECTSSIVLRRDLTSSNPHCVNCRRIWGEWKIQCLTLIINMNITIDEWKHLPRKLDMHIALCESLIDSAESMLNTATSFVFNRSEYKNLEFDTGKFKRHVVDIKREKSMLSRVIKRWRWNTRFKWVKKFVLNFKRKKAIEEAARLETERMQRHEKSRKSDEFVRNETSPAAARREQAEAILSHDRFVLNLSDMTNRMKSVPQAMDMKSMPHWVKKAGAVHDPINDQWFVTNFRQLFDFPCTWWPIEYYARINYLYSHSQYWRDAHSSSSSSSPHVIAPNCQSAKRVSDTTTVTTSSKRMKLV